MGNTRRADWLNNFVTSSREWVLTFRGALIGCKIQKVTEILTKKCEECGDVIRMEWADWLKSCHVI